MKKQKYISLFLSICMLSGAMALGGTVKATENENILYYENFDGDSALDSHWTYASHGTVSGGELLIANGKYPLLNLPDMEEKKSYELSYKVKFEQADGAWKVYNDVAAAYMGFGSAVPGTGFSWLRNEPKDGIMNSASDLNKWYTVKVEFCTDVANRYTKWTLLDETGKIADTQARAALYSGAVEASVIPVDTAAAVKRIYFWNSGNSGNIHVDDIILKEVTPSELVIENFASGYRDSNLWKNNTHGAISEGVMTIAAGQYPYFKLPDSLNTEKAYRLSYKIKGGTATNASGTQALFKPFSDVGGANFVGYRPGQGFTCAGNDWANDFTVTGAEFEKLNEWYLVETEFCQSASTGYSKWTIRDASGKELYSKKIEGGLKKYTDGEGFVTQNLAGTNICLWNNMSDSSVIIDDLVISLVQPEESSNVLLEEAFDVADLAALKANGNGWRGNAGGTVAVADSALQLHKGAYIYFDVPKKTNKDVYKLSYDIKVSGESSAEMSGSIIPNTALVAETGEGYLLGVYNPLKGLSTHKLDFAPEHTIAVNQANDKWHTVTVEFSENEEISFMQFTLTDRMSGNVVGSYSHPYLESSVSNKMITGNATTFYFWNRGSDGSVAYIDNVKLERIALPYIYPDTGITAVDYFGNESKTTDGLTPATEKIIMKFTAEVTQETAAAGIALKEKNGAKVPAVVTVEGKTVTMDLEKLLKANTCYELTIADTVLSKSGIVFSGPVSVEVTTAAASKAVGAVDTLPAANLEMLTPGGTLEVGAVAVNPGNAETTATLIAAFYSDNVLVNAQICNPMSVPVGEVKRLNFAVAVPQDMSKIDLMKVFLWDDLFGIVPYGEYKELLSAE